MLLLLPVVIGQFIYSNYRRKKNINSYGDPQLLKRLIPSTATLRNRITFWFTFFALALTILLLARPQFGAKKETVTTRGVEVVVDVAYRFENRAVVVVAVRLDTPANAFNISSDTDAHGKQQCCHKLVGFEAVRVGALIQHMPEYVPDLACGAVACGDMCEAERAEEYFVKSGKQPVLHQNDRREMYLQYLHIRLRGDVGYFVNYVVAEHENVAGRYAVFGSRHRIPAAALNEIVYLDR